MQEGSKAIDFTLANQDGEMVSLSDFIGKKVVLYFYPKDNTPGCTRQACAFTSAYNEFKERDIVVIGISKDSVASHKKFQEKHHLPFILLSDPTLEVVKAYDVWALKKIFNVEGMGISRTTFIIDEQGMIIKRMEKVKPDTNAAEILQFIVTVHTPKQKLIHKNE